MRTPAPVIARVQGDQLYRAVIIMSSPVRFSRGGRARLARLAMNHQAAIRGRATCRPRVRIRVRVCSRS